MKDRGTWVSLEGIDAVGKTSLIPSVASSLRERLGIPVVTVVEFSNSLVGRLIRDIIRTERFIKLSPDNSTSLSESLLLFTDRLINVETVIFPIISQGKLAISDRSILSTLGYQSQLLKNSPLMKSETERLDWLKRAIGLFPITPDLNIVLTAPIEEVVKRVIKRGENPLNEEEKLFLLDVDKAIKLLAPSLPGKVEIIDAFQEPNKVVKEIADTITLYINEN